MGLGCNACGVSGCRIIDSPRERLIGILTNVFVPCNGRFPIFIAVITMFFTVSMKEPMRSAVSVLMLMSIVIFGVFMTFVVSRILSKTVLHGVPSSFALELPPYRAPQIGRVIVRSVFDRTLFVLGRAVAVAAPAGLVIWCLANISVGGVSLISHATGFLDPFARMMGLDGVILLAFILALPANEIVFPIIIMTYLSTGSLAETENLLRLREHIGNIRDRARGRHEQNEHCDQQKSERRRKIEPALRFCMPAVFPALAGFGMFQWSFPPRTFLSGAYISPIIL